MPHASRKQGNAARKTPTPRPLVTAGSIELTDSEDESLDTLQPSSSQKRPLVEVMPGSLENILEVADIAKVSLSVVPNINRDDENAPPAREPQRTPTINALEPLKPDLVIPQDPLAQVLEVIPDVLPEHVQELFAQHQTTEAVLNALFENPQYPKVERKVKRKAEEQLGIERGQPKPKIDYASTDRPPIDADYYDLALEQLQIDFPLIPKPHIRSVLQRHKNFYVPTYVSLVEEAKLPRLPYKRKTIPYRSKGKSKIQEDAQFTAEREWLLHKLQGDQAKVPAVAAQSNSQDEGDPYGIECGCCFTSYAFEKMIQCPDAHLFCTECMVSYAENLLGSHNPNIVCMDQSGCKLAFPESELRRFLDSKLLELYERVKQRKEIEAAGLEGLEECPFCEYKVVIENPDEKLFRCEREECGAVSCRNCKKLDHLPRSCKEMEEDRLLDGRHSIEEAMTQALLRNCPKCQKAFIKEAGCNKMTCPNCHTLSCYVCRQIITGYDHFNQNPNATGPGTSSSSSKKCLLWDQVEQRHADEVKAAAERALADYRREHPDVEVKDLKVDLPPAPKQNPAPALAPGRVPGFGPVGQIVGAQPPPYGGHLGFGAQAVPRPVVPFALPMGHAHVQQERDRVAVGRLAEVPLRLEDRIRMQQDLRAAEQRVQAAAYRVIDAFRLPQPQPQPQIQPPPQPLRVPGAHMRYNMDYNFGAAGLGLGLPVPQVPVAPPPNPNIVIGRRGGRRRRR